MKSKTILKRICLIKPHSTEFSRSMQRHLKKSTLKASPLVICLWSHMMPHHTFICHQYEAVMGEHQLLTVTLVTPTYTCTPHTLYTCSENIGGWILSVAGTPAQQQCPGGEKAVFPRLLCSFRKPGVAISHCRRRRLQLWWHALLTSYMFPSSSRECS